MFSPITGQASPSTRRWRLCGEAAVAIGVSTWGIVSTGYVVVSGGVIYVVYSEIRDQRLEIRDWRHSLISNL
jgi:hypothetical protein